MKHSDKPRQQLAMAVASIEEMRGAKSKSDIEKHWTSFLHRLERVWNKARNHFGKSPKWKRWKREYEQLRKKDPLLAYLWKARGEDEHTVNDIVSSSAVSIGIRSIDGESAYADRIVIRKGTFLIDSPQNMLIEFAPARAMLLPIVTRHGTYPVPTSHLGKSLDSSNIVEVAETGAKFYDEFLKKAEAFFVK